MRLPQQGNNGWTHTGKYACRAPSKSAIATNRNQSLADPQRGLPLGFHTLKAGLSASIRACATRSWTSAGVILNLESASFFAGFMSSVLSHVPEAFGEGVYCQRCEESVYIVPICYPQIVVSGICRHLEMSSLNISRGSGSVPLDQPLRGRIINLRSTSTKPASVIQFCSCNAARGSLYGCRLCKYLLDQVRSA